MLKLASYVMKQYAGDRNVLRQCQLVQLRILHSIDKICKANGIEYFLESGTLLGALRHEGFIPWDDDLDIGMTIPNYRKFMRLAPALLPSHLFLQDPKAYPHIAIPFAKIRDTGTFYYECRSDTRSGDPSGIYVDIFPYEEIPNVSEPLQWFLLALCSSSWSRVRYFYGKSAEHPWLGILYYIAGMLCNLIHFVVRGTVNLLKLIPGRKFWTFQFERSTGHRRFKKDWISSSVPHKFEDGDFPVPIGSEEILTVWYGDWREIPPPNKRPRHARIIDPFHSAV